jgi:hypothetical protein
MFMVLGFLTYNRVRIFSMNNEKDLDLFLDE